MLLGRERECAAIDALLDGGRASRSGALVIRGEPGIGKSALLRYAIDAAHDMHVLSASGVEAESELPFAGLHQLLWEVLELADALPAVQAAALRGAFGLSEERVHDRFLVSVAVLGMLTAVADRRPLLCVVDDAHWLDSGSADALTFAARRLHADAVAILIAAREGETRRFEAPGLPELVLEGLPPADASALIDGDSDLAPAVREALVRATGGNPLALRELPGALTAEQRAGRRSLDLDLPLTEGIERAFLTRVQALDDDARRLLVLAAADDTGDIGAVLRAAELLGLPATALDAAERMGLLATDGVTVRFQHPLVRSAVYRAAPFGERSAAHRALATGLPGAADADRAAWHRALVANPPDDDVADALADAADRAQHRGGYAAAARALERAAELHSDLQRRAARLVGAAAASALAGRMSHARILLDRAEPGITTTERRVEAARVRGQVELAIGRPADARAALADAAEAALPCNRRSGLELLAAACVAAALSGEFDRLRETYGIAARIEPDPHSDAEVFLVRLLTGLTHAVAGEAAAAPLIDEAVARTDAIDDPRLVEMAGSASVYLGEWTSARRLFDRAIRDLRERGAVGPLPQTLALRASLALWNGQLGDAAEAAGEALQLATDIGAENQRALPLTCLAGIAGIRGEDAECRRLADEALGLTVERGLAIPASLATWALAQLDVGAGRWEEALVRLLAVEDVRPGFGYPFLPVLSAWDRVEAAVHAGRPDIAKRSVELLRRWAEGSAPTWAAPILADCLGLTASADAAGEHFEAALNGLEGTRPLDRARIQLHYGEHLRRERRRIDARAQLRAAFDDFDRMGAAPWAERARRELRATGETARKRDLSPLAQLTPQELQVARLVGEGATNKAVASQLFVSPKTVEYHLRKVFDKLGIASRGELMRIELDERAEAQQPA